MKRQLVVEKAAERDLVEETEELREKSPDAALRFVEAVQESFDAIAAQPGIGRVYYPENEKLQGMQVWHVHGFRRYLVFYRVLGSRVQIERVIYGTRDILRVLGIDGE